MSLSELQEILNSFVLEAEDNLQEFEKKVISLENNKIKGKNLIIDDVFRILHTLKGGAGFLGLIKFQDLSHEAENLLDEIRNNSSEITPEIINVLLKVKDTLVKLLLIAKSGEEDNIEILHLVLEIKLLKKQSEASTANKNKDTETDCPDATYEEKDRRDDSRRTGLEERRKLGRRQDEEQEASVRVSNKRLDDIMNLVGELMMAKNFLETQIKKEENQQVISKMDNISLLLSSLDNLSRITKDLQSSVLGTRMQPIRKIFDKIPRQVRELKKLLNKDVNLVMKGENTEIDKALVDELIDPMMHIIRNSMDHGIETSSERSSIGKPKVGSLTIEAFHEGGNLVIQVADDGRGIDVNAIKEQALKKGIFSKQDIKEMPDKDIIRLILFPGISTAKEVSDISGRGVGLDIVEAKVSDMKGHIDIESKEGEGTKISIYIPSTLAVTKAVISKSCSEKFAIPINSISEVITYNKKAITEINGSKVLSLRGEEIPLLYLKDIAKNSKVLTRSKQKDKKIKTDSFIIIVKDVNMVVGICTDDILGQEEIVIKPIKGIFRYHSAISGAAITGDGGISMILDIPYLMKNITNS